MVQKEKTKNYLLSLVRSAVASAHVIPLVPGKKTRMIMMETSGSFDIRSHFPAKNVSEEENNMITFWCDISKF